MDDLEHLPKPKSLFIGIDQSYGGFGLVVFNEKGEVADKQLLKFKKTDGDGERLLIIFDYLNHLFWNLVLSEIPVKMAMEGYAYGAKLNREKMGELGGIVKTAWYDATKKEAIIVAPTELKKFMTGKGNASKADMVAAVQKLEPDITDHNLADAYGLAYMIYCNN